MHRTFRPYLIILLFVTLLFSCTPPGEEEEEIEPVYHLPSWNNGEVRDAILAFVENACDPGHKGYVDPADRIAVFDNDGTLWAERPMYFQLLFALDRVKAMAPDHPEWQEDTLMNAVISGDMETVLHSGMEGLMRIIMTSHAGMSTEDFGFIVQEWLDSARHPTTGKAYTEMVYQPMLELIEHLHDNDFKVFIVSGGGIEFMRPWVEHVYGIPQERVVGSSIKVELTEENGRPVLKRQPEIEFIDDKEGKPVGIHKHIGKRPVLACGNSDGDLQMLQWTEAGYDAKMMIYIHHTDSVREWAYDRESHIGRFDKGLDIARENGWTIVDMENDWATVFPFEREIK